MHRRRDRADLRPVAVQVCARSMPGSSEGRRGVGRFLGRLERWPDYSSDCRDELEIVAAVLTGVSNARSEALNRIAKLEARQAYSFRTRRTSADGSAPPAPAAAAGHLPRPRADHLW